MTKHAKKMVAEKRRFIQRENLKYGNVLKLIPKEQWSKYLPSPMPDIVWRSNAFLVQQYNDEHITRLSINRCGLDRQGNWLAAISWEELQEIKSQCGFADVDAVEVFPKSSDVVNVANLRHLWVLKEPIPFAWRNDLKNRSPDFNSRADDERDSGQLADQSETVSRLE